MNGLEFLEQIKELYPYAIRILISAYGSNEVIDRGRAIGIQGFIEKPFTSETIEKSLSQIITVYSQK